jgi:integrase
VGAPASPSPSPGLLRWGQSGRHTTDRIADYIAARQQDRPAGPPLLKRNGTINRELAVLTPLFMLAIKGGRLSTRPALPETLTENGARQGFVEPAEYTAVLAQPSEDYQDVLDFLCWTGWRWGAVRDLTWADVHLGEEIIQPAGGTATKKKGRIGYGQIPAIKAIIERRFVKRGDLPHVFHYRGRPIGD